MAVDEPITIRVGPKDASSLPTTKPAVDITASTKENAPKSSFNQAIVTAATEGGAEALDLIKHLLLDNRSDPTWNDFAAVKTAVESNNAEIAEFLLLVISHNPNANLAFSDNFAMKWAAKTSKLAIVRILVSHPSFQSM
jgi:hypothetical protein